MAVTMTDTQEVTVSVVGRDGAGQPTAVAGPVTWSVSDAAVLTVTPSADTLSAVVASTGVVGVATVSAVADGFTGTVDVTVTGGPLASLELDASAPVEKPAP